MNNKKTIPVWLPADLYEALKREATEQGETLSSYAEKLLAKAIQECPPELDR